MERTGATQFGFLAWKERTEVGLLERNVVRSCDTAVRKERSDFFYCRISQVRTEWSGSNPAEVSDWNGKKPNPPFTSVAEFIFVLSDCCLGLFFLYGVSYAFVHFCCGELSYTFVPLAERVPIFAEPSRADFMP